VDYDPWLTGVAPGTLQAVIDNASPGDVIQLGPYIYEGVIINKSITLQGVDGTVIHGGSPAFTVTANDVTIENMDIDGSTGVNAGISDLWIRNCEIHNWGYDGIHFSGAITGLKVINNTIHDNGSDGIEFTDTPAGTVQIYGNSFRSNTDYGINNADPSDPTDVLAEYNEWGSVGGPKGVGGDDVSANVDYDPWVFGKLWVDAEATVRETEDTTVYIKMDVAKLFGTSFNITFDETKLQLKSDPVFGAFATGASGAGASFRTKSLTEINASGVITVTAHRGVGDSEYDATDDTLLTLVFTAQEFTGTDQDVVTAQTWAPVKPSTSTSTR